MSMRHLGPGEPQLHHRQQAVAAGHEPGLRAVALEQRQRVVDAGGALVLEWRGCLHVVPPGPRARPSHGVAPGTSSAPAPAGRGPCRTSPKRRLSAGVASPSVTLTQLEAFVLVARLGLGEGGRPGARRVSEPAVSGALAALRQHLGDPLSSSATARAWSSRPAGQRLVGDRLADGRTWRSRPRPPSGRPRAPPSCSASWPPAPSPSSWRPACVAAFTARRRVGRGQRRAGQRRPRCRRCSSSGWPTSGSGPGSAALSRSRSCATAWSWSPVPAPAGGDTRGPGSAGRAGPSIPSRRRRWPGTTGSSARRAPIRRAMSAESWPGSGSRLRGCGCSPARPPPGRRRPKARAWRRPSAHLVTAETVTGRPRSLPVEGTPVDLLWYVSTLSRSTGAPRPPRKLRRFLATPDAMQVMPGPTAASPPRASSRPST